MSLDTIYKPIQGDMARVEEGLRSVCRDSPYWMSELLEHSLGNTGKRVRPALVFLSGSFTSCDRTCLLPMALAVEVLHTATLVHDDAIDKSATRRGKATIYQLWGEDKAVLLGDYLLAQSEELAALTENISVLKIFSGTIKTIACAEIRQSLDAFDLEQTRENYLERISGKTASLLCLATRSGAILSGAEQWVVEALNDYACNIGIAFQIVDDILDFVGNEADMGKPVGSDLAEGTLTLPAMLLLEHYPDRNPVRKLFEGSGEPGHNIEKAIDMFRNSSLVEECYRIARNYYELGLRNLMVLPENAARHSLEEIAGYVIARRK
ncbi:MAG: polyprenyl synthetase family protein [Dehalococcoidales bacterium]